MRSATHQALLARAIGRHQAGKLDAAVAAYQAIVKRHPETCACWSNLGMALRTLGRKDEGLKVLREGVRVCPRSVELNFNVGNALKDVGDHEGALKYYRAAWTLKPDGLEVALACGAMLVRLERFDEASSITGRRWTGIRTTASSVRGWDWRSGSCRGRLLPRLYGARSRSIRRHPTCAAICTLCCAGWGMTKKTSYNCARVWRWRLSRRRCSRRWDRA